MIMSQIGESIKYQELVEKCQEMDWRTLFEAIAVSYRGFAGWGVIGR